MRTGTTATVAHASGLEQRALLLRRAVLGAATAAALVSLLGAPTARAASTWTGAGAGPNWSDAGNWVGGAVPGGGDALVFAGTTQTTNTNDRPANTSFAGISFDATAGAFTLGGNAVLLAGDIVNNSASAQSITLAATSVTANGNLTYATGGLVLDGVTANVSTPGGGALSLGQVTFGAQPQSANVSTLNINNSVSASGLTVQTNSDSTNAINIASGQTFTVGGNVYIGAPATATGQGVIPTNVTFAGGGALSVTGGNVYIGLGSQNYGSSDHNSASVDMTGLSSFSYTGGGNFGVGWMTRPDAELRLSAGTNTIVASSVRVGESGRTGNNTGSPNNNGSGAELYLGAGANIIHTGALIVGQTKGDGTVTWQDSSSGSVTIAAQDGVGRADIIVGHANSGGATSHNSELLLAGHNANVLAGTVQVGWLSGSTTGAASNNRITFDTGTFDVNTLQLGVDASTSTSTVGSGPEGIFVLGTDASSTGVLNVNTAFDLGSVTSSNTSSRTVAATFTVNGGMANVNADIASTNANSGVTLTSTLNLNGGTLDMKGHSIGSAASPVTAVNLSGGTLANAALVSGTTVSIGGTALNDVARITGTTMTVTGPLNVAAGTTTLAVAGGGTLTETVAPLTLVSGITVAGGTTTSAGNVNGNVIVQSGAGVAPGMDAATAGTLQFANDLSFDGGSGLRFKLTPDAGSGNDMLNVSGNLTFAGSVNLEIGALGTGATIGQTYTLINYSGALTGSESNLVVIGPGSRKTFTVVPTSTTPNQIQVAVGGSDPLSLTYVGNGGSTWQVAAGPSIWVDGSSNPQQFFNQDTVTFDDTSTNPADVQLVGALTSGGVTVSANRGYKFAGSGSLTGTTGLTKALGGTLVVATNNTNTGTTDIQAGTVRVGDGGTVGSLGPGAINDNGTLAFNRSDSTSIANAIGGSGNVVVEAGTVTLTGANTYGGTTTVRSGALLRAGTASALGSNSGGAVTVESGGTFDINGVTSQTSNFDGKTFNIAGVGVSDGVGGNLGALYNSSSATQLYAFENIKLTDDAMIRGSRIDIGRTATGGTLDLNGKTLTTNMSGTQPVFSVLDGTTVTAGNIVVNTGGLNIERSAVVDTLTGTITFNTGTVFQAYQTTDGAVKRPMVFKGNNTIGSGSTTAAVINSPMQLDGDVTLQAVASGAPGNGNNPLELKGAISGVGGITKAGTNSVTLSGTNTYAGATAVSGGTLVLGGSNTGSSSLTVADGAIVQVVTPAGGGPLTERFGALDLGASGTFDIDGARLVLTNTTSSTLVSYLSRGRAADTSWTGTGLTSAGAQSAADPSRVRAIGWAVAGDAGLTGGSWGSATGLATSDIVAKLTYYGDLNLDGRVNGDDYTLLDKFAAAHGLGSTAPARWIDGDVNYDGVVTSDDYLLTDTAFGLQSGTLSPEFLAARQAQFGDAYVSQLVAAVPEPATIGLAAAAGSMLALRRRRK